MAEPIRLLLVDDHQMVIDGLKAMLSRHDEVAIVGEASSRDEALVALQETTPDIVLLDVRLRGESGLDLAAEMRGVSPECRIVFLTVYDDEQYLFQALRTGASGFLLKRVDADELLRHLAHVQEGEIVIDPTLAGRVAASAARIHRGEFWPGAHLGLTQRESEVLALVVSGRSNRAVGATLHITEETVKSHTRSVYRKMGVADRTEAVAMALREGLFH
ncbi:response regulator [Euzebya rosea]|uniref:response regulator n=1 Tax=Euzebya rosea TaxID=2052804 RepID=UPI000D3E9D72|nr:response regulator transcription factor [Euzebya rosea]